MNNNFGQYCEGTNRDDLSTLSAGPNEAECNASSTRHLPDEIMEKILSEALSLPNGIQGGRYEIILRARVNKFALLGSRQIQRIVPEALYKHTKVVVQPMPCRDTSHLIIAYPTSLQSWCVREPEFEAWVCNLTPGLSKQLSWLQKLASGTIEFENLDTLRCSVVFTRSCHPFSWFRHLPPSEFA